MLIDAPLRRFPLSSGFSACNRSWVLPRPDHGRWLGRCWNERRIRRIRWEKRGFRSFLKKGRDDRDDVVSEPRGELVVEVKMRNGEQDLKRENIPKGDISKKLTSSEASSELQNSSMKARVIVVGKGVAVDSQLKPSIPGRQQPETDHHRASVVRQEGDNKSASIEFSAASQFTAAPSRAEVDTGVRVVNRPNNMQLLRVTSFTQALDIIRFGDPDTLDPTSVLAGWFHHNEYRRNTLKQTPETFAQHDHFDALLLYTYLRYSTHFLRSLGRSAKDALQIVLRYLSAGMAITTLGKKRALSASINQLWRESIIPIKTILVALDKQAVGISLLTFYALSEKHLATNTTTHATSLVDEDLTHDRFDKMNVASGKEHAPNCVDSASKAENQVEEDGVPEITKGTIHKVLIRVRKDLAALISRDDPKAHHLSDVPPSLLTNLCSTRPDIVTLKEFIAKSQSPTAVYSLISIVQGTLETRLNSLHSNQRVLAMTNNRVNLELDLKGGETICTKPRLSPPPSCDATDSPPTGKQGNNLDSAGSLNEGNAAQFDQTAETLGTSSAAIRRVMFKDISSLETIFERMPSKPAELSALELSMTLMRSKMKLLRRAVRRCPLGDEFHQKSETKLSILKKNHSHLRERLAALKKQPKGIPEERIGTSNQNSTPTTNAAVSTLSNKGELRAESDWLFDIYFLDWSLATLSFNEQASFWLRAISTLRTRAKFLRRRRRLLNLSRCHHRLKLFEERYKMLQGQYEGSEKIPNVSRSRNRLTRKFYATVDQDIENTKNWKVAEEKTNKKLYKQYRHAVRHKAGSDVSESCRRLKRQYETSVLKLETANGYLKSLEAERSNDTVPETHADSSSSHDGLNARVFEGKPDLLSNQPLFVPYNVHHYVLGNILYHIKEAMFKFGRREFPLELESQNWTRPENIAVTEFMAIMARHPLIAELYTFYAHEFQSLRIMRNSYAHSSTDITLDETCTLLADMRVIARVLAFTDIIPPIKQYEKLLASFKQKYNDANNSWREKGLAILTKQKSRHKNACANLYAKVSEAQKHLKELESTETALRNSHDQAVSSFLQIWKQKDRSIASQLATDLATYALEERVRRSLKAMSPPMAALLVRKLSAVYPSNAAAMSDQSDINAAQALKADSTTSESHTALGIVSSGTSSDGSLPETFHTASKELREGDRNTADSKSDPESQIIYTTSNYSEHHASFTENGTSKIKPAVLKDSSSPQSEEMPILDADPRYNFLRDDVTPDEDI
ncbi:hypothetical protein BKA66DRAFT_445743 [Pyrenochaeta sp. MPI-SDFR-AT-0127]|nr:hypothetical protein BKA66DRAFT_445743 [Pyrenochaeta sp. MPI-SDFR-AT-0127]